MRPRYTFPTVRSDRSRTGRDPGDEEAVMTDEPERRVYSETEPLQVAVVSDYI
jgi:hypothetical protein